MEKQNNGICKFCSGSSTLSFYKENCICEVCLKADTIVNDKIKNWQVTKSNADEEFLDNFFKEEKANNRHQLFLHFSKILDDDFEVNKKKKKDRIMDVISNLKDKEINKMLQSKDKYKSLKSLNELNVGEYKVDNYIDPKNLFKEFSKYIIGQDDAKEVISIAFADYFCRLSNPELKKSNILICGPTGTGKTEFARVISKFASMPMVEIDATSLTGSGYVGNSPVETIVKMLMVKSNNDQSLAEKGIVYIDEIDKIAAKEGAQNENISSGKIQQELLKALDGDKTIVELEHRNKIEFNFKNVMIVASGAFNDFYTKPKSRKNINLLGGTYNEEVESITEMSNKDLIDYGLYPEFVGRFAYKTNTKNLSKDEIKKIFTEKENSITHQYIQRFSKYKVVLSFDDSFIDEVVEDTCNNDVGVRIIEQIMFNKMRKFLFNVHDYINKKLKLSSCGNFEVSE